MKSPTGRLAAADHEVRRASNLRRLREARSWNQVQLARKLDMSHTYIVSMESGARPITLRTIDKLAPALGLTAAQLLAELDAEMGGAR